MGRLAAWVAHELRNPLQNLVGLIAELREQQPDGGRPEFASRPIS